MKAPQGLVETKEQEARKATGKGKGKPQAIKAGMDIIQGTTMVMDKAKAKVTRMVTGKVLETVVEMADTVDTGKIKVKVKTKAKAGAAGTPIDIWMKRRQAEMAMAVE